jgi:2-methylisocitrate lyase-like PEP mutase family enzyme
LSVRQDLRAMLRTATPIVAPGAYDAMTGKAIERLGFKAIYCGGEMTGHHLGVTEPLLTLTEQVDVAARIASSVGIPVIVDGDAGFGDPVHVARCVRDFEAAGVAGIHIEDQVFPKMLSYTQNKEFVVSRSEYADKIKAALDARRDPDFLIIGRTDAWKAENGSHEEGLERAQLLAELGVDVIFPLHNSEPEAVLAFREAVADVPMMAMLGRLLGIRDHFEFTDSASLFQSGYVLQVFTATYAVAMAPVIELYKRLRETGRFTFDMRLAEEDFVRTRDWLDDALGLQAMLKSEAQTTGAKRSNA